MSREAMKRLTRDDTEHGVEYYRADEVDALLAKQPAQQSCYCPNCEALGKELAALKAQPQEPVKTQNEFEQWCASSGHDYCFDLNEIGEYQWADAQGAYEAYWARNTSPQAQRKPLTRKQLADAWIGTAHITHATERQIAYARAVEAAHGIKPGVWYSLNDAGEFQEHQDENE